MSKKEKEEAPPEKFVYELITLSWEVAKENKEKIVRVNLEVLDTVSGYSRRIKVNPDNLRWRTDTNHKKNTRPKVRFVAVSSYDFESLGYVPIHWEQSFNKTLISGSEEEIKPLRALLLKNHHMYFVKEDSYGVEKKAKG